jgi:glutamyl/glutaminyl-tRNA synthetase
MGAKPPIFAHLPLILGENGQPLSKRMGDFSVKSFREQGYPPEGVVNYLSLLGWAPGDNREILSREEIIRLFSIERVNASPARFDPKKMIWVLHQHFQQVAKEELIAGVISKIPPEKRTFYSPAELEERLLFLREHAHSFVSLAEYFQAVFSPKEESSLQKDLLHMPEGVPFLEILKKLKEMLAVSGSAYLDDVQVYTDALRSFNLKGPKLYKPLRLILTGALDGPELKLLLPKIPKKMALDTIAKHERIVKG